MIWTKEQNDEFSRLAAMGISYAQVAERLTATFGIAFTRNACIGKANRLGLQRTENRYCGLSPEQRKKAQYKRAGVNRRLKRWADKPWLADRYERLKEIQQQRIDRAKVVRANCKSKTSPTYRKNLPRLPEMTKGELRMMLRQAVENTVLMN